ncbi:ABC transporter ATP-binding protein [Streptomyces sp. NPDC060223]|uniref:ABC transporter ATP-binding protein n=1 Tax=unclassified Streptomyces TaxID=2593676 RepID=UPI003627B73B
MTALPVVSSKTVRRHARRLLLRHPVRLVPVLVLHALAAALGLTAPWLLGRLVEDVQAGQDTVATVVPAILGFLLTQSVLIGLAVHQSARLAEQVIAELREDFVRDLLRLPLARVESAGVGDLVTRSTRDVDALARIVRDAVPSSLVALTAIVTTLGALLLTGPLMVVPCLLALPLLWPAARWYLARARDGYLRERSSYARTAEVLTETVEGARTVEALGTAPWRVERMRRAARESYGAERHTLWLRSVFLPVTDTAIAVPTIATLVLGGIGYDRGWVSLGAVTAATLYAQQLAGQIDVLLYQQDKLQVGGASMARLLGVSETAEVGGAGGGRPQEDRRGADGAGPEVPSAPRTEARVEARVRTPTRAWAGTGAGAGTGARDIVLLSVSHAYQGGPDVLHDIDLTVRAGERLAVVGPSGAGKSTLGRLIAGIDRPRAGSITVAGLRLDRLSRSELRAEIAMVTQDYHVFRGSVRDNLLLARSTADDREIDRALTAVGADGWVTELGLGTPLHDGGRQLSPAEAQQLSLARLLLTDPHTLVLDEATSLLNPRLARDLERSLAAVSQGRTVISIAHRLHTAYDADRVVVLEDGRIVESGPHRDLLGLDGAYAALWRSWHGEGARA